MDDTDFFWYQGKTLEEWGERRGDIKRKARLPISKPGRSSLGKHVISLKAVPLFYAGWSK